MVDLQKLNNILVMMTSGIIATIGYNLIPFKAYIIVAAISGLIIATIITSLNYSKK